MLSRYILVDNHSQKYTYRKCYSVVFCRLIQITFSKYYKKNEEQIFYTKMTKLKCSHNDHMFAEHVQRAYKGAWGEICIWLGVGSESVDFY